MRTIVILSALFLSLSTALSAQVIKTEKVKVGQTPTNVTVEKKSETITEAPTNRPTKLVRKTFPMNKVKAVTVQRKVIAVTK
jgi:hypothetical protein